MKISSRRFSLFSFCLMLCLAVMVGCQQQPAETDQSVEEEGAPTMTLADPETDMVGEWVTYGDNFRGYLVGPMEEGEYPGVVMIHEWWGLNQNIKNMAHELAKEGYNVLAVDLYDGRVAESSDDAGTYAGEVRESPERAIEHMRAAAEFLRGQDSFDGNIGSMGWCFGGGMSMQLALNEPLDATVIYYGNLETDPEALSVIDWPILGVFGEEDTSITVESVNAFEAALNEVGIENEIYVYEGVGHAFANPSNDGHDPAKTADAWEKTVNFLNENLKG